MCKIFFLVFFLTLGIANAEDKNVHVIQKGETLSHVSDKYKIKIAEIMKLNGMTSQNVRIGQKIKIPNSSSNQGNQNKPEIVPKKPVEQSLKQADNFIHIVQKGETLSHVSDKYKIKIAEIMKLNGMKNQNVWIGMKIKIPGLAPSAQTKEEITKPTEDLVASADSAPAIAEKVVKESNKFAYPNKSKSISQAENGVNISSNEDFSVVASKKGVVIYIGDGVENLKKLVIIKHDSKYTTLYGNLIDVSVTQGEKVNAGQKIGYFAKSKPLFFAIRENGSFVSNVANYID